MQDNGINVSDHLGLVYSIASKWRRYFCSHHNYEDMQSECMVALCMAAKDFDPSRGFKFSTLATTYIENRIRRLIRDAVTRSRRIDCKNYTSAGLHAKTIHSRARMGGTGNASEGFLPPPSLEWECRSCGKYIDWDAEKGKAQKGRNLCSSCDRRFTRAKAAFGEGGCPFCSKPLRQKRVASYSLEEIPRESFGFGQGSRIRGSWLVPSCVCEAAKEAVQDGYYIDYALARKVQRDKNKAYAAKARSEAVSSIDSATVGVA